MSEIHILIKGERIVHTYSMSKCNDYIIKGWKYVMLVHGWNAGVTYV